MTWKKEGTTSKFTSKFGKNKSTEETKEKPLEIIKVPEELKDKNLGTVIDDMENTLKRQTESFLSKALQIARWDRMIFDCIELVEHLEDQLTKTEVQQIQLQRNATALLHDQEVFIKKMKDKTPKTSFISVPEDQRDRIYKLAQRLGNKYSDMETQLKEMADQIDKSNHFSEVSSDMDKMARITNCHLSSLQWISYQCNDLDEKVEELSKFISERYSIPK